MHSSYDILFYEIYFFNWNISQKYDFLKKFLWVVFDEPLELLQISCIILH